MPIKTVGNCFFLFAKLCSFHFRVEPHKDIHADERKKPYFQTKVKKNILVRMGSIIAGRCRYTPVWVNYSCAVWNIVITKVIMLINVNGRKTNRWSLPEIKAFIGKPSLVKQL